jgi:hypothetical protein
VAYGGGIVAIEDAVLLGIKPNVSAVHAVIPINAPGPEVHGYTRPPQKYSDIMKVSVQTILTLKLHTAYPLIAEMLDYQRGQLEYAVAALAIWMTTATGQYVSARLHIWKIPLCRWDNEVKQFGSECRRLGQVFGGGQQEVVHAMGMRRIVCLAGRTDADADWAQEVLDRTTYTTAKRGYSDGYVSTLGYWLIRAHTLKVLVSSAMPGLVRRSGDLTEYISSRWWNTPRGTTSEGGHVKHLLKQLNHAELDLQLRPIKPVVHEVRDIGWIMSTARKVPAAHARGSTKPEPGLKRRALLAVDDATAFIAGYASQHVETTTKAEGMVLRQDPADVSEWVNFDIGPTVWRVSNDYSNFNILNSLRSMQLIDMEFACHWQRVPYRYAEQKKLAHMWVAASYLHPTFSCPAGEFTAKTGLWSGHRNTARDNTMLHVVYLNCIKSVMNALFADRARVSKQRICGDDETVAYSEWAPAVCHTLVADALGFKSQVSKGMLSLDHDEFLQLVRWSGQPPTYPVANTILSYCSGNWYKDPVRDLGTTPKDISDHAWDMHLGGVPLVVCQGLATQVLNYLMQVKTPNGELVPLEWMTFRGCGLDDGHPLWRVSTVAAPIIVPDMNVHGLPRFSTNASLQRETAIWNVIGREQYERVARERLIQSYRHVAKNTLTREYDRVALDVWPRRGTAGSQVTRLKELPPIPANRWRAIPVRAVDRSARAVAIRVGFPPELVEEPEMWKALPMLKPRERAVMLQGWADKQEQTLGWRWRLPPLLRVA